MNSLPRKNFFTGENELTGWPAILAAIAAATLLSTPAMAIPITYAFTGTLVSVEGGLPSLGLPAYAVGQAFSGTVTLDTEGSDHDERSNFGNYDFLRPPYGATFTIATDTFSLRNNSEVQVLDDATDGYLAGASGPMFRNGTMVTGFEGRLEAIFWGVGLPDYIVSDALLFPGFLASNTLTFGTDGRDEAIRYTGVMTSFAPVPLPAGLYLLSAGLVPLGYLGWRKRRVTKVSA